MELSRQSQCIALLGDGFELEEIQTSTGKSSNGSQGTRTLGNYLTGEVSRKATELKDASDCPEWFHSTANRIKTMKKDPAHKRSRKVYTNYLIEKE